MFIRQFPFTFFDIIIFLSYNFLLSTSNVPKVSYLRMWTWRVQLCARLTNRTARDREAKQKEYMFEFYIISARKTTTKLSWAQNEGVKHTFKFWVEG